MSSREYNAAAPFQTIAEACRTTGMSRYFLRRGCKNGSIPHLKVSCKYMIDVPTLMKLLHRESDPACAREHTDGAD